MNAVAPLVYTVDEVADILKVNRKTVYELAGKGEIPCRRFGRRILFGRRAIDEWVNKPAANDERSRRR